MIIGKAFLKSKTMRKKRVKRAEKLNQKRVKLTESYFELITQIPENNALIYPQAKTKLQTDHEVLLGINSCAVCGQPTTLTCNHCHMIDYCSEAHQHKDQSVHLAVCSLLRLIHHPPTDQPALLLSEVEYEQEVLRSLRTKTPAEKRQLYEGGWFSYTFRLHTSPSTSQKLCDLYETHCGRQLTQTLSYPLSLALALSNTFLEYPLLLSSVYDEAQCRLVVHVIGAADNEVNELPAWRELLLALHLLLSPPFPLHLLLLFFGPQLPSVLHQSSHCFPLSKDDQQGEEIQMLMWQGEYNVENVQAATEYFTSLHPCDDVAYQRIQEATVVAGYHMGLSVDEYDWQPAFQHLLSLPSKPLLYISSFTQEEARRDRSKLLDLGFNCLLEPNLINPFASALYQQSGTLANDLYNSNRYVGVYKPPLKLRSRPQ